VHLSGCSDTSTWSITSSQTAVGRALEPKVDTSGQITSSCMLQTEERCLLLRGVDVMFSPVFAKCLNVDALYLTSTVRDPDPKHQARNTQH
jgi:hypothetical protein